ncbi:Hypothetical predicted protein [Octopus vulgaris]|uniref:Uncharacterized protein n=1 Tax=Octopus vulgaris TaxID=6645 RepID=A0AA36ANH3_OCTVU|nr:Hypothetical predicted protein [Octopus vulgaris]
MGEEFSLRDIHWEREALMINGYRDILNFDKSMRSKSDCEIVSDYHYLLFVDTANSHSPYVESEASGDGDNKTNSGSTLESKMDIVK